MVDPLIITLASLTATFLTISIFLYKKYKTIKKRLHEYLHPPPVRPYHVELNERQKWLSIRCKILMRDKFKCVRCKYYKHLEVHHIVSKSKGGGNNPENLITLCSRCHKRIHGFKYKHNKRRGKRKRKFRESRYFREHKKEYIFQHNVPPNRWDDEASEDDKKNRREEIYKKWLSN